MIDTTDKTLFETARARLLVHQAGQVRTCIDALNEGQLWWRANEASNTIGNLVLHLCGSTRFYIGHCVGNKGYVRDRDAEFAEQASVTKEDLLARFDATVAEARLVLTDFNEPRLGETTDLTGTTVTYGELILNQVLHFTAHAGQIVYATKLIQTGVIDEVWTTTPMG